MTQNFVCFITNNGKEIIETNYYQFDRSISKFYLSINAGAFRLLVPKNDNQIIIKEIKLAKHYIIRRGWWNSESKGITSKNALNIIFDDKTTNPFQLFLTEFSVDRFPSEKDEGKDFDLYIYALIEDKLKILTKSKCNYKKEDFTSP